MKYISSKQDATDFLRGLFQIFNYELYKGELHDPIIDVGVLLGNQCSRYKPGVWIDAKGRLPEIMFSGTLFARESISIDDIATELLHCMAHQYCDENGIKDTSCKGNYHNKNFKKVAEAHGLICTSKGKGYNIHQDYSLSESIKKNDTYKNTIADFFIKRERFTGGQNPDGGTGHSIKYACPCCGNSVRATKSTSVICGYCMEPMEKMGCKYNGNKT